MRSGRRLLSRNDHAGAREACARYAPGSVTYAVRRRPCRRTACPHRKSTAARNNSVCGGSLTAATHPAGPIDAKHATPALTYCYHRRSFECKQPPHECQKSGVPATPCRDFPCFSHNPWENRV